MIIKTQAIVLRAVKYGETSLIVTMLTSDQGLQSYIINGVRTDRKPAGKASHYLPGSWLQLEAYHREGKNINRIKEAFAFRLFTSNSFDPVKNAVVLFMSELMEKCLKHPEKNEPLFRFLAGMLEELDACDNGEIMHCLISFVMLLPEQLGLGLERPLLDKDHHETMLLDLAEGSFVKASEAGNHVLSEEQSLLASSILAGEKRPITRELTASLLEKFMDFYRLHFPEFGKMKTLAFLKELIS
jgi:DNA repair protein RecO (recombination protein O)